MTHDNNYPGHWHTAADNHCALFTWCTAVLCLCPCPLSDVRDDNAGGVDAEGGPDPLTPTRGDTPTLDTTSSISKLYTHNYNWFNRYISVWDIFNHKILQSAMFEPAILYSIIELSILAPMGAQEVMCVCLPQTCAYCSSFWFRFQADFKWT